MGMFDANKAAKAAVRSSEYLRAGIHDVKFTGVEKNETERFTAIEFTFTAENGAQHNARLFAPTSDERKPNRFDPNIEDPSQAEQFMCKLMHIISALDPTTYKQIQDGILSFAPSNFDNLVKLVKRILDPKVGTEVQIKLIPNNSFAAFPSYPARIDKNGDLYLTTSFIGHDLTLSAYEKQQIDKALDAKPTPIRNTSELDEIQKDLEEGAADDDDSDLPF